MKIRIIEVDQTDGSYCYDVKLESNIQTAPQVSCNSEEDALAFIEGVKALMDKHTCDSLELDGQPNRR